MAKTFEKYLTENIEKQIIDFTMRASITDDGVEFYIHPDGQNGETLDFWITGNQLVNKESFEEIWQMIRKKLDDKERK